MIKRGIFITVALIVVGIVTDVFSKKDEHASYMSKAREIMRGNKNVRHRPNNI